MFFTPKAKQTLRVERTTTNSIGHAKIDPDTNILGSHLLVWGKVTKDGSTVFMNEIVPEFSAVTIVMADPWLVRPAHVAISFSCGNHFSIEFRLCNLLRKGACQLRVASRRSID